MRDYKTGYPAFCRGLFKMAGPKFTLEQLYAIQGSMPGGAENAYGLIDNLIERGRVEAEPKANPAPKPTYEKPKRPVRVKDLEEGCVLRYCGGPNSGDCGGRLKVGEEVKVIRVAGGQTLLAIPGWDDAWWAERGMRDFDFVSNPNYAHGLDIRKTYYLRDQEKYSGQYKGEALIIRGVGAAAHRNSSTDSFSPSGKYVNAGAKGKHAPTFPVEDLTTELPKKNYNPEGYPALTEETAQVGAVIRYVGWEDHYSSCPKYGYETTIDAAKVGRFTYACERDDGGRSTAQNWTTSNANSWVLVKPAVKPDVTITAAEYERLKALDVPKEDMTDPKNWKVGDILRRTKVSAYAIKAGTEVVLKEVNTSRGHKVVDPIAGPNPNGDYYPSRPIATYFEWVRRPTPEVRLAA